jgi:O-antigen ligase
MTRIRPVDVAWLVLLFVAVALSLTRTSILASLGVLVLIVAVAWWDRRRAGQLRLPRLVRDGALLVAIAVPALVGGIALNVVSTPSTIEPGGGGGGGTGQAVIDRVVFDDVSGAQSIGGGRFTSYRKAIELISQSPVIGLGMGALTPVAFAYDETRAYTIGQAAGVDNAYLTVGLKAGIIAMILFAGLILAAFWAVATGPVRRRRWLLPGLAGIAVLTITQSFATSLYGPAILAALLVLPALPTLRSAPRS